MNVKHLFLTLLGLSYSDSSNLKVAPISTTASSQVISMLNGVRRSVGATDMCDVSWSQPLADSLAAYSSTLPKSWYFNNTNLPNPNGYGNHTIVPNKTFNLNLSFNGFHLMHFAPFNTTFPGYDYVIHDTFQNPGRLGFIIQFRLNQLRCINWGLCDPNTYQSFKSCGSPLVQIPSQPCSWATQYAPRLMFSNLTEIACVTFKEHGPSAPAPQGWSFFCYGKRIEPVNDMPFSRAIPAPGCRHAY